MNIFNFILVFTSLMGLYYAYGFYQQKKVIEYQNSIFDEINQKILEYEEKLKEKGNYNMYLILVDNEVVGTYSSQSVALKEYEEEKQNNIFYENEVSLVKVIKRAKVYEGFEDETKY